MWSQWGSAAGSISGCKSVWGVAEGYFGGLWYPGHRESIERVCQGPCGALEGSWRGVMVAGVGERDPAERPR